MAYVNTEALPERVEQHLNDTCISLDPVVKSTFHLIYHVTMVKAGLVVVRVSHHFVNETCRPMKSKMLSEVATIRYLKRHTSIPVPDNFAYDPGKDNVVGGSWMVMESVDGNDAATIWDSLSPEQKHKLSLAIGDLYSSMLALRFNAIESIYADRRHFFIGPMVTIEISAAHDTAPDANKCGPHITLADWLVAFAQGDTKFALPPSSEYRIPTHQSYVLSTVNDIKSSSDIAADQTPIVLDHINFSLQNIIVRSDDPTVISGIIDWEAARMGPMWAVNPCFRWAPLSPPEEQHHFHGIPRDRIKATTPEWWRALGEEALPMRLRARCSMWAPGSMNFDNPPHHFLSTDTAPTACIINV